jgi:outer membrane protein TolC
MKIILYTLFLISIGSGVSYAEENVNSEIKKKSPIVGPLKLEKAIEMALDVSPEIQQLQAQLNSSNAKSNLAWAPAEPSVSFGYNDLKNQFTPSSSASHNITVSQTLGFPGRAFLNSSMYDEQTEALREQLRALRLQVSTNVKTAYYNLQLARRNIELNSDTRLAYERIVEIAKRRYESGATAQVDFLNAQVQLLTNQNELADLENSEKSTLGQLNALLERPVDESLQIESISMVYHVIPLLDEAMVKMIANRHEILAAQATYRASDKAYSLAWMQLLPDFQLSAGINTYDDKFSSPYSGDSVTYPNGNWPTQTYSVGVQVTVPIWGLFNERQVIKGAAYDRGAAQKALDLTYVQSKVALETSLETLRANDKKIRNFEAHILPLAEQSLRLAIIDYSTGKVDFQTLADTASARRQARINYANAVVTYLTTYSTFGQLIGEDLR